TPPLAMVAATTALSSGVNATSRWPMLLWASAALSEIVPTVLSATGIGIPRCGPMPNAAASSLRFAAPTLTPSSANAVLQDRRNASNSDAVGLGPQVDPL